MKKLALLMILILVLLVYACNKKNSTPNTDIRPTNTSDFHKYATMGLDSPFISRDTANVMLSSYLNSISGSSANVKSFIVDADALRYYLSNTNIKHVKLMLAHKLNYVRGGGQNTDAGYNGNAFTIIISGFDSDNNYIYSPQGAVLDFSQPCPYNCVTDGTAANDLFPAQ
jgi:hypothetical protein